MKQAFIIETDSEMSSVFLYEGQAKYDTKEDRWVIVRGEKIINALPDPKFYGILDSLIITQPRILKRFQKVKPITPEQPEPYIPLAVREEGE